MCNIGDIYYAALPVIKGSQVQQGVRPVLIVSNNKANQYSPIITVIPLTSSVTKTALPTHVTLTGYGLEKPSILLAEQILSLDKKNLLSKIGAVKDYNTMLKVKRALSIQLSMVA